MSKRKSMSEEQKKRISETMKKKWQDKQYRQQMCEAHKHELPNEWKENEWFCILDYLPYESVVMLYD